MCADTRGVAAVEFALTAPILIVLLLGTLELGNAFRVQGKLNVTAGQLAEQIAEKQSVVLGTTTDKSKSLTDMCYGASLNMLPYNPALVSGSIGSTTVINDGTINPYPDWTTDNPCPTAATTHAGAYTLGYLADLPSSLFTASGKPWTQGTAAAMGYSAVEVTLSYSYQNIIPFFLGKTITFTASAVARPRNNTTVACTTTTSGTTSPCPVNF